MNRAICAASQIGNKGHPNEYSAALSNGKVFFRRTIFFSSTVWAEDREKLDCEKQNIKVADQLFPAND